MATTILPKKTGQENPMALDDDQHNALAADPTIPQFVQGSTYETSTVSTGTSAFSVPSSGGFSPSSSFGSPTTTTTTPISKPAMGKSARFAEADPDSVFDRG